MNGTDDIDSSWDALATDLGLEPAKEDKPKPAPAVKSKPAPKREPEPEPEAAEEADSFRGFGGGDAAEPEEIAPEVSEPAVSVEETAVVEDSFGVLDDEAPAAEEGATAEGAAGEGTGRRRRRRRRRRKGGGEQQAAVEGGAPEEAGEGEEPVAEIARDDEPAEIIGDAAQELDDEDEGEEESVPSDLEGEGDSTEPLPDKQVVAWTDLIATLYRPQDR